ncbi:MAG: hypothetical protein R2697_04820 [Ilumatobacteraceae bacterium]
MTIPERAVDVDGRATFRRLIGDFDQIDVLVDATVDEFGGIDIVVFERQVRRKEAR